MKKYSLFLLPFILLLIIIVLYLKHHKDSVAEKNNVSDNQAKLNLALNLLKARKVKEAENMFNELCSLDIARACFELGNINYFRGDMETAKMYWQIACDLKNSWGCFNLGVIYNKEKKPFIAYDYFSKACNLKNAKGCRNIGYLDFRNNNLEMSKINFNKACKLGDKKSCEFNEILIYNECCKCLVRKMKLVDLSVNQCVNRLYKKLKLYTYRWNFAPNQCIEECWFLDL